MVYWVLLSRGSDRDPKLSEQMVRTPSGEISLGAFLSGEHISTLEEEIVNSCHGNTDHTVDLARQIAKALVPGRRIAAIGAGTLGFAKPGIEAANSAVIPFVSVPISLPDKPAPVFGGLDSFLSCDSPPGMGAVGVAGFNNYTAAANVARSMLKDQLKGVYVHPGIPESVDDTLRKYNIPFKRDADPLSHLKGKICLMPISFPNDVLREIDNKVREGFVLAYPLGLTRPEDAVDVFRFMQELKNTLYVGGDPTNLAHYTAKVFATRGDVGIAAQLREKKDQKAKSYKTSDIGAEMARMEDKLTEGR